MKKFCVVCQTERGIVGEIKIFRTRKEAEECAASLNRQFKDENNFVMEGQECAE